MARAKKSRTKAEVENNPGRRKRPEKIEPELLQTPPPPPKHLTGEFATALWQKVARELVGLKLLSVLDLEALAVLCDAWQQYQDMAMYSRPEHATFETDRGYVAEHPGVRLRAQAATRMAHGWRQFGLTPLTRESLDVDLQPDADNSIAGFAGRRD